MLRVLLTPGFITKPQTGTSSADLAAMHRVMLSNSATDSQNLRQIACMKCLTAHSFITKKEHGIGPTSAIWQVMMT